MRLKIHLLTALPRWQEPVEVDLTCILDKDQMYHLLRAIYIPECQPYRILLREH